MGRHDGGNRGPEEVERLGHRLLGALMSHPGGYPSGTINCLPSGFPRGGGNNRNQRPWTRSTCRRHTALRASFTCPSSTAMLCRSLCRDGSSSGRRDPSAKCGWRGARASLPLTPCSVLGLGQHSVCACERSASSGCDNAGRKCRPSRGPASLLVTGGSGSSKQSCQSPEGGQGLLPQQDLNSEQWVAAGLAGPGQDCYPSQITLHHGAVVFVMTHLATGITGAAPFFGAFCRCSRPSPMEVRGWRVPRTWCVYQPWSSHCGTQAPGAPMQGLPPLHRAPKEQSPPVGP